MCSTCQYFVHMISKTVTVLNKLTSSKSNPLEAGFNNDPHDQICFVASLKSFHRHQTKAISWGRGLEGCIWRVFVDKNPGFSTGFSPGYTNSIFYFTGFSLQFSSGFHRVFMIEIFRFAYLSKNFRFVSCSCCV